MGWGVKKEQNLRNGGRKMISAAASAPPQSSSNKRISFNLVTTGASHCTAADLSSKKSSHPPTLKSRTSCLTSESSGASALQIVALPSLSERRQRFFFLLTA